MNTERSDVDRALRHWFDDGPTVMPDRVVDGIEARIARQPQRRAWRLQGRPFMHSYAKLAAAAAAILVVGIVGWQLLPANGGLGGPAATATANPSPTATADAVATTLATVAPPACSDGTGCLGALAGGPVASSNFAPGFTFTGPNNWINSIDESELYEVDHPGFPDYVLLWSGVAISQHTASCAPVRQPGVGNTVNDWITFVTTHPGMDATKPVDVVLGSGRGKEVTLLVKAGWTKSCENLPGPSVQFIMHADKTGGTYGAASWMGGLHLTVLDVGGQTVLLEHYGWDIAGDDMVSSMRFAPAVGTTEAPVASTP